MLKSRERRIIQDMSSIYTKFLEGRGQVGIHRESGGLRSGLSLLNSGLIGTSRIEDGISGGKSVGSQNLIVKYRS